MLAAKQAEGKFACVGLDSEYEKIPEHVRRSFHYERDAIVEFNAQIINATKDLASCYKPNLAFYIPHGSDGIRALKSTISYIRMYAEDVPIILDAKHADIGNTNKGYVASAFDYFGADAVTVHPYLGREALKPFLDREEKGIIVLCKTSNPGAGEFQDLVVNVRPEDFDEIYQGLPADAERFAMEKQMPLWKFVAHRVHGVWNRHSRNCALVVGATYPEDLAVVRSIVGEMNILIPGVGTQGGDVDKTVKAGAGPLGRGMIINSSSGIIFASKGTDFPDAARRKTQELNAAIAAALGGKADVRVSD